MQELQHIRQVGEKHRRSSRCGRDFSSCGGKEGCITPPFDMTTTAMLSEEFPPKHQEGSGASRNLGSRICNAASHRSRYPVLLQQEDPAWKSIISFLKSSPLCLPPPQAYRVQVGNPNLRHLASSASAHRISKVQLAFQQEKRQKHARYLRTACILARRMETHATYLHCGCIAIRIPLSILRFVQHEIVETVVQTCQQLCTAV